MRSIFTIGIVLTLAACGSRGADSVTENEARENAVANLSSQTYEDVGDISACTDDCGGHDAGFEWAKDNDVNDESECSGDSDSFVEGCQAYVQHIEQATEEAQSDDT